MNKDFVNRELQARDGRCGSKPNGIPSLKPKKIVSS